MEANAIRKKKEDCKRVKRHLLQDFAYCMLLSGNVSVLFSNLTETLFSILKAIVSPTVAHLIPSDPYSVSSLKSFTSSSFPSLIHSDGTLVVSSSDKTELLTETRASISTLGYCSTIPPSPPFSNSLTSKQNFF